MSVLWQSLRLLRQLQEGLDPSWQKRIEECFRDAYLDRFEQDKKDYIERVLQQSPESGDAVAKHLGYKSRSMINAMKKGSISLAQFDLIQATLGGRLQFPSPAERRCASLVTTIIFVRRELMQEEFISELDAEGLECLEQALVESRQLARSEDAEDEGKWLDHVLNQVKATVPMKRDLKTSEVSSLLVDWGPAYVKTKSALEWFVRRSQ